MRSRLTVSCRLLFLLLALIAALPPSALALTASQVYEQVKDSVVVVKAYDQSGKPVGLGSGVRLPSGDVITNYHVVKTGVRYTVGQGKKGVPATVKAGDPDKDLCLLTAPGLTAKPARLGQAVKLKVGEPVYAVGAPQGLELSLSEGIVSQLRGDPPPLIQTTVAISQGSSGGGLFNAEGELVGITTFYLKDSQSLNFALPVEWIGLVAKRKTPERRAIVDDKSTGASVLDAKPKEGWENRAIALEKAKDWQGLLDHCRRWTKAEPDNDFAGKWFMVARCLIKTLEEPDSLMAWNNLGSHYSAMGRYREALEAYRKAITLKNAPVLEAIAWSGLSETYAKLNLYREAIEAARQALRFCPTIGLAWNALGNAYAKLGRHNEAIDAYRESLRHSIGISETMAEAWSGLALSYSQLGNRSAALKAINELKKYDPKKADQLFNVIIKP